MNDSERLDYKMSRYRPFSNTWQLADYNSDMGYYFFTPDSMSFFNSRIGAIYHGASPVDWNIFITSEKYDWNSPRLYTIRQLLIDGSTRTISAFQEYAYLSTAKRAVERYLRNKRKTG